MLRQIGIDRILAQDAITDFGPSDPGGTIMLVFLHLVRAAMAVMVLGVTSACGSTPLPGTSLAPEPVGCVPMKPDQHVPKWVLADHLDIRARRIKADLSHAGLVHRTHAVTGQLDDNSVCEQAEVLAIKGLAETVHLSVDCTTVQRRKHQAGSEPSATIATLCDFRAHAIIKGLHVEYFEERCPDARVRQCTAIALVTVEDLMNVPPRKDSIVVGGDPD